MSSKDTNNQILQIDTRIWKRPSDVVEILSRRGTYIKQSTINYWCNNGKCSYWDIEELGGLRLINLLSIPRTIKQQQEI